MLIDDPTLVRPPTGPWVGLDFPIGRIQMRARHTGAYGSVAAMGDFELQAAIQIWTQALLWSVPAGHG